MIKKIFTLMLCVFCSYFIQAQTSNPTDFDKFAQSVTEQLVNAYQQKDIKTHQKVLDEFLVKYNKLDDKEKKKYSGLSGSFYYNFACVYSLLNDKKNALIQLDNAIKNGYLEYAHMQEDTDLDNIRNEEQFKKLLEPLRSIRDYPFMLRKADKYNNQEKRELPKFTYQSKDNENLVKLRKAFNLDSVAGKGNDVSQIIALMHWMHNKVMHDGNHENPEKRNALDMINLCKTDKRGLNCRGMAIALNECYLALGFKSRFVTCLPKDSLQIDQDCHVINSVFVPSLNKWIWIDPTFDAYVMNEKGELLGIEEVRERIIKKQPLIINPDANWNHQTSQTIDYYLYFYMAKNLYMLECPVNSEYDFETFKENKKNNYIRLQPLEYYQQTPVKEEVKNSSKILYRTNNAEYFWQKS